MCSSDLAPVYTAGVVAFGAGAQGTPAGDFARAQGWQGAKGDEQAARARRWRTPVTPQTAQPVGGEGQQYMPQQAPAQGVPA